jgi:hypothetical protein
VRPPTRLREWWGGVWAKTPAPVPDRHVLDGVSVLQSWPGVKRKAPGDARHCSGEARWSYLDGRDWHGGDGRLWDAACSAFGQQPESEAGNIIEIKNALQIISS